MDGQKSAIVPGRQQEPHEMKPIAAAPSRAHEYSRSCTTIDPFYSASEKIPPRRQTEPEVNWLYPRAEYECFQLLQMRRITRILKMKVGYTENLHQPSSCVHFRRKADAGILDLRIHGDFKAFLNGTPLKAEKQDGEQIRFRLPAPGQFLLTVCVDDDGKSLPSIASALPGWEASAPSEENRNTGTDDASFTAACPGGNPYGEANLAEGVELPLKEFAPGRFDAGREILAEVEIHSPEKPTSFGFGESPAEMENRDPAVAEQNWELLEKDPGIWKTPAPIAFRYLRAESGKPSMPLRILCRPSVTPVCYRGAFAADEELNRIWICSAYTLRMCMQYFLLDGIKRDRLPWVGDLALSVLASAYTFAEAEPIRRSLVALGRPGIRKTHLNGVVDYSLWYLIAHDSYQLYFSDPDFLQQQYPEISEHIDVLLHHCSPDAFLIPYDDYEQNFTIDWIDGKKTSALQTLFYWSLHSAARLARRRKDDALEKRCRDHALRLKQSLFEKAWDPEKGLFFDVPGEPESGFHRHANFLAILGGLTGKEENLRIVKELLNGNLPPAGTPFMLAFELLAMYRAGEAAAALAKIREVWGGMLQVGATTFFEAWDSRKKNREIYSFYDRPYGLSLCHAWSSGPAFLLPLIFSGCEATDDGWKSFRAAPLKLVPGQAVTIPTPYGQIEIYEEKGSFIIESRNRKSCP